MPYAVCLHSNIYDETETKRLRGDTFEASQDWIDWIIARDAEAERPARISMIQLPEDAPKKRGRPKKEASDEDS
ncbi:hypothetical protein PVV74_17405 [Roseovarius sp. SK2]|uniref:hypothetical protein n=1 Tax=Roseovarius TaxID=74030 RepID=UPI00237B5030|nr:hypothetical protein [Roseovarius sp. SK2]MDD9727240.1 hypothetical protein [Roseovarius sp. SK2]